MRWAAWATAAVFKSKASLVAENLCLRQQFLVLQRNRSRPRLRNSDRRFWILACRWFTHWRKSLLIVKPETVLGWHRKGWKVYWRKRSRRRGKVGRHRISAELRALIRRMACPSQKLDLNPLRAASRLEIAYQGDVAMAKKQGKHRVLLPCRGRWCRLALDRYTSRRQMIDGVLSSKVNTRVADQAAFRR